MQKVLTILGSAVLFCFVTVAKAQVSDTASLNYNNQSTVEDTHVEPSVKQDNQDSEQADSRMGASSGVKEGTVSSEDQQVQQLAKPTAEQTDQNTPTDAQPSSGKEKAKAKRGKSALKKGNSFYEDDAEKRAIKKSKVKDKADHD